jgi:hypothetical protein
VHPRSQGASFKVQQGVAIIIIKLQGKGLQSMQHHHAINITMQAMHHHHASDASLSCNHHHHAIIVAIIINIMA